VDTLNDLVFLLHWKFNTINFQVFGIVNTAFIKPLKNLLIVNFISATSKHWINDKMLGSFVLDVSTGKHTIQHHLKHFSVTLFENVQRYEWLDGHWNDWSHGVWDNVRSSFLNQLGLAYLKNLCSRYGILFQHISKNIIKLLSRHTWLNLLKIWFKNS